MKQELQKINWSWIRQRLFWLVEYLPLPRYISPIAFILWIALGILAARIVNDKLGLGWDIVFLILSFTLGCVFSSIASFMEYIYKRAPFIILIYFSGGFFVTMSIQLIIDFLKKG